MKKLEKNVNFVWQFFPFILVITVYVILKKQMHWQLVTVYKLVTGGKKKEEEKDDVKRSEDVKWRIWWITKT